MGSFLLVTRITKNFVTTPNENSYGIYDKANSILKDGRHCLRKLPSLERRKFQIPSFWPLDQS